ncbi:MAG: RibD family protein [Pseudomonadota bacterium]
MTSSEHDWQRLIEDMAAGETRAADAYPKLDSLAPLIEAKRQDKPLIIAQLGQSLDGRIATASGDSHYINGPAALQHLHRLRALVDAVVVGAGTVISDDPQLTVRRVPGPSPTRIIIDPNNRAQERQRWCRDDGCQHFRIVRAGDGERNGAKNDNIAVDCDGSAQIPVPAILTKLQQRGFKRLLIEGGATTVSQWLQAGALDRLHVLIGPLILGDGPVGLSLTPTGPEIADAWHPAMSTHPLPSGDLLVDCDLRAVPTNP